MDSITDKALIDKRAKRRAYLQSPEYKAAQKAYQRAYQQSPEYKAAQKARNQSPERKAYQQSPEWKAHQKAYRKSPEGKATRKAARLKRKYGMSLADYNQMLATQNGKCKICGRVLKEGKGTHVDHNHTTGNVRGLLCHNCNLILGYAHDNDATLIRAAKYLTEAA